MEKLYGISNSLIWPNGFNKLQYLDIDNFIYDGFLKILVLSKAYPHKRLNWLKSFPKLFKDSRLKPDAKITINKSDNAMQGVCINRLKMYKE